MSLALLRQQDDSNDTAQPLEVEQYVHFTEINSLIFFDNRDGLKSQMPYKSDGQKYSRKTKIIISL